MAFTDHILADGHRILTGQLPQSLCPGPDEFAAMWQLHPPQFTISRAYGFQRPRSRWEKAFGRDYPFSGGIAKAAPVPALFQPVLEWCRERIHDSINGLFVNWHDGALGHYHPRHRDKDKDLLPDSPIVTISFGEERILRLRPWPAADAKTDFVIMHGTVVVLPFQTNRHWTHEIPRFKRYQGKRISVTARSFQ